MPALYFHGRKRLIVFFMLSIVGSEIDSTCNGTGAIGKGMLLDLRRLIHGNLPSVTTMQYEEAAIP